jgi:hypothetical protein
MKNTDFSSNVQICTTIHSYRIPSEARGETLTLELLGTRSFCMQSERVTQKHESILTESLFSSQHVGLPSARIRKVMTDMNYINKNKKPLGPIFQRQTLLVHNYKKKKTQPNTFRYRYRTDGTMYIYVVQNIISKCADIS